MATLALPSEAELSQLSKNDLIGLVQRSVGKLQTQSSRIKKLAATLKEKGKEELVGIGLGALDYGAAAAGGAGVGYLVGSIQRKIADGEEGYDEDSLLFLGLDVDLAVAAGGALAGYFMAKKDEMRQYASYVKLAAIGALSSWAGRMGYEYGMTPPEEEAEQQAA